MRFLFIFCAALLLASTLFSQEVENRPQTPKPPFNYTSEDVTFVNPQADGIKLAGTLTMPKGVTKPTVAILISGSGPQDRNSRIEQFNHSPFLVLSDYLSNHEVAVLRYDDRGVAESEGDFEAATSYDFASDVHAAIAYLKTRDDLDPSKIGLIGHSEGGLIAPIVAADNEDVAFMVLLAGPGVDGATVLETQSRKSMEQYGVSKEQLDENEKLTTIIYGAIQEHMNDDTLKAVITRELITFKAENPESIVAPLISEAMINQQLKAIDSEWIKTFIRIQPMDYLRKANCPVLALNGEKDVQVISDINLAGIRAGLSLAPTKDTTIMELPDLNHLFQKAETGSVQEYSQIEETYNEEVLGMILMWINERF